MVIGPSRLLVSVWLVASWVTVTQVVCNRGLLVSIVIRVVMASVLLWIIGLASVRQFTCRVPLRSVRNNGASN